MGVLKDSYFIDNLKLMGKSRIFQAFLPYNLIKLRYYAFLNSTLSPIS